MLLFNLHKDMPASMLSLLTGRHWLGHSVHWAFDNGWPLGLWHGRYAIFIIKQPIPNCHGYLQGLNALLFHYADMVSTRLVTTMVILSCLANHPMPQWSN
jgi:hypothetical protein